MDDAQRQPKDSDRARLTTRITRAGDEGRIGPVDRDIRLGNVRSATSMAELDLISRELDQLDAALPAPVTSPVVDQPWSKFTPTAGAGDDDDDDSGIDDPGVTAGNGLGSPTGTGATAVRVTALVAFVAIAVIAAAAVFVGFNAVGSDGSSTTRGEVVPGRDTSPSPAVTQPSPVTPVTPGSPYALSGPGFRAFLQTYRQRFGTTRVVDLTLYGDYAIVSVPVPGKARAQRWLYRRGSGWTTFGGVSATSPGATVFDVARLAIPGLARNLARAAASLEVEEPAQSYVILRYDRPSDAAPTVNVYRTNKFNESGYLATTMEGRVLRAYPFGG